MTADTTLFTLIPSVPVTLGTERVFVRPVIVAELPAVERVVDGWRMLVATGGDFLHAEAWADFLDICAAAAGRNRTWLDALSEGDFERLICHVLAVNEEIWKPADQDKGRTEVLTWSQISQRLVEHGHAWEAVQRLTLAQARTFLGECFRLEAESMARDIQAAAFSMADQKSVERAVKGLRRV